MLITSPAHQFSPNKSKGFEASDCCTSGWTASPGGARAYTHSRSHDQAGIQRRISETSPVQHLIHAPATYAKMQTVLLHVEQKQTKVLLALPTCGAAFGCDAFALPQAAGALSGRCRMLGVCEPRPDPRPDLELPCRPGCSHPSSAPALLSADIK